MKTYEEILGRTMDLDGCFLKILMQELRENNPHLGAGTMMIIEGDFIAQADGALRERFYLVSLIALHMLGAADKDDENYLLVGDKSMAMAIKGPKFDKKDIREKDGKIYEIMAGIEERVEYLNAHLNYCYGDDVYIESVLAKINVLFQAYWSEYSHKVG